VNLINNQNSKQGLEQKKSPRMKQDSIFIFLAFSLATKQIQFQIMAIDSKLRLSKSNLSRNHI
jgi:hypothetical protein